MTEARSSPPGVPTRQISTNNTSSGHQTETPAPESNKGSKSTKNGGSSKTTQQNKTPHSFIEGPGFLLLMLGGFFLLYMWMGRGRKKQEAKRKEMLANLRKGDKVTTIGGIVGTVIEVRDHEVNVKVDENNNVRMKFARWGIRSVGDVADSTKPEDR